MKIKTIYRPRYNTSREYENKINEIRVEECLSLRALGEKVGVSSTFLWSVSQGYVSPLYQAGTNTGQSKPWADKLCEVFNTTLAYIFPMEICDLQRGLLLPEQEAEMLLGAYSLRLLAGKNGNRTKNINKVLATLTPREEHVVRLVCLSGETLEKVGKGLCISKQMVSNIYKKALRKLRHPTRDRTYYGDEDII